MRAGWVEMTVTGGHHHALMGRKANAWGMKPSRLPVAMLTINMARAR